MQIPVLGAVALAAVGALVLFFLLNCRRRRLPKGFRYAGQPLSAKAAERRTDCLRDGFKPNEVPEDLDAIVIGSGMGGLACAAMLARGGRRVVVLEQHYVAGGCTHVFKAEQSEFEFDTGVHYVGEPKTFDALMSIIGDPDNKIEWSRLGSKEEGFFYDLICAGDDKPVPFTAPRHEFRRTLLEAFPGEEAAIDKYMALVKASGRVFPLLFAARLLPRWLARLVGPLLLWPLRKYAGRSPVEVINGLTENKRLRAVLLGQYGDYGGPPSAASFLIHAAVASHYWKGGGFYPVGGSEAFARAFVPLIEKFGGRVFVRAPVARILYDEASNAAVGVEMERGQRILAPLVISSAGVWSTFTKLLPREIGERNGMVEFARRVGPSVGHMYVFIGLRGSPRENKLPNYNIWHIPLESDGDYDVDAACRRAHADPELEKPLAFISFPSSRDPTWEKRFPGISTAIVIGEGKWEWYEQFKEQRPGHREEAYQQAKRRFAERAKAVLLRYCPQLKDKIEYVDVGTPLSNANYIAAPFGESYGLAPTRERFLDYEHLRPDTSVKGLFMTGQDISTNGVMGAIIGGIMTANKVMGYPSLMDLLTLRDVFSDLKNVPIPKAAANGEASAK